MNIERLQRKIFNQVCPSFIIDFKVQTGNLIEKQFPYGINSLIHYSRIYSGIQTTVWYHCGNLICFYTEETRNDRTGITI